MPILQKVGDSRKERIAKQNKVRELEKKEFFDKLIEKSQFCFFLRKGVKYFGRIRPEKGDIRL